MSFYSLISSHLSLCASLFLFYFGFMSCLLFVWKGWCDPRTGNAVELLIYHRFVLFSCWFRCTELFILHFSEFEKISCNFLSNWAAFACLEPCCFPEAQSQPAEGVLPPAEPPVPAQRPKLPVHERGVRNPALHPEVPRESSLCSLWHLSLDFFDFQLFEAQAVRLVPNCPLSLQRTVLREHSTFLHTRVTGSWP